MVFLQLSMPFAHQLELEVAPFSLKNFTHYSSQKNPPLQNHSALKQSLPSWQSHSTFFHLMKTVEEEEEMVTLKTLLFTPKITLVFRGSSGNRSGATYGSNSIYEWCSSSGTNFISQPNNSFHHQWSNNNFFSSPCQAFNFIPTNNKDNSHHGLIGLALNNGPNFGHENNYGGGHIFYQIC